MNCISALSIPRPNGRGSKDRLTVPCGKCAACLSNRRINWSIRLMNELRGSKNASFITITYNEKNNKGSLSKIDVQLFLKRFRQLCNKVEGNDHLRYFITGEYGKNSSRPHYHCLFFNLPEVSEMELYELVNKAWKMGSSFIGNVTEASIMYTAKYLLKGSIVPEGCEEPFSIMSRRPGIGYSYVERMGDYHHDSGDFSYTKQGGVKMNLPRFYKEKIFNINQKEERRKELIKEMDDLDNEKLYDTFAKGENPFVNEMVGKNNLKKKIDKIIKKGSL